MSDFLGSSAAGLVALGIVGGGLFLTVYLAIALPDSPLRDLHARYMALLEGYTRFLLIKTTGPQILRYQVLAATLVLLLLAASGNPLMLIVLFLVGIIPWAMLNRQKQDRILKLERQLDGWLMMLANALKATPAIGEALRSTAGLVQAPMAQELDLIVKEHTLGTPVDQALLNAGDRIGSAVVSGAFATLIIARQTGGDLPRILETSAASLREMYRLEGVVRTKTAEGKGQVVVLAAVPFFMVGLLGWLDPTWLAPLTGSFVGTVVVMISSGLWLVAVVWARSILDVDV